MRRWDETSRTYATRPRRGLAALVVNDVCTSLIRSTSDSCSESRFMSLPATTLARVADNSTPRLTAQEPSGFCPRNPYAFYIRHVVARLLSKTPYAITDPIRSAFSGPPKLACPRPARAACDNVGRVRRLSSEVTTPIFLFFLARDHHRTPMPFTILSASASV